MSVVVRASIGGALLWATTLAAQAAEPATNAPPVEAATRAPVTKKERASSQDRILAALQQTAEALRSRSVEPAEMPSFRELLAAAEALRQDESVTLDRREKWRGLARVRLVEAAALLRRQVAQQAKPPRSVATPSPILAQVPPLGGIGTNQMVAANEAQELIDLITGAVRSETWEVNGGEGTIRYWSFGSALIINNTPDVHERIGGSLRSLR